MKTWIITLALLGMLFLATVSCTEQTFEEEEEQVMGKRAPNKCNPGHQCGKGKICCQCGNNGVSEFHCLNFGQCGKQCL